MRWQSSFVWKNQDWSLISWTQKLGRYSLSLLAFTHRLPEGNSGSDWSQPFCGRPKHGSNGGNRDFGYYFFINCKGERKFSITINTGNQSWRTGREICILTSGCVKGFFWIWLRHLELSPCLSPINYLDLQITWGQEGVLGRGDYTLTTSPFLLKMKQLKLCFHTQSRSTSNHRTTQHIWC